MVEGQRWARTHQIQTHSHTLVQTPHTHTLGSPAIRLESKGLQLQTKRVKVIPPTSEHGKTHRRCHRSDRSLWKDLAPFFSRMIQIELEAGIGFFSDLGFYLFFASAFVFIHVWASVMKPCVNGRHEYIFIVYGQMLWWSCNSLFYFFLHQLYINVHFLRVFIFSFFICVCSKARVCVYVWKSSVSGRCCSLLLQPDQN